jgi:hypothetical protein
MMLLQNVGKSIVMGTVVGITSKLKVGGVVVDMLYVLDGAFRGYVVFAF